MTSYYTNDRRADLLLLFMNFNKGPHGVDYQ